MKRDKSRSPTNKKRKTMNKSNSLKRRKSIDDPDVPKDLREEEIEKKYKRGNFYVYKREKSRLMIQRKMMM